MSPDIPLFPDLLATPWRFLWHLPTQTAILSDLHLGTAPLTPRLQAAWSELISRHPKQIVLAGDVLDHPSTPPALLRSLTSTLPPNCHVTLTPGNHDPIGPDLTHLANSLHLSASPSVQLAHYLISHGNELPPNLSPKQTWIVGHQHPAVTLRTRVQSAKLPCYALKKPTKNHPGLLLLPAFNRDAGGPLGSNLLAPSTWLLPTPRPSNASLHIYGLIERATQPPQLLAYGTLSTVTQN